MFKFTSLCLMAVIASAVAAPGLLSPFAAYSAHHPASYAAQIGYSAPIVSPYASSYNAHQIDHSVAYPAYQYAAASAAYAAAPSAYAASQSVYAAAPSAAFGAYAAAPSAYALPSTAYASHSPYGAPAYTSALLR